MTNFIKYNKILSYLDADWEIREETEGLLNWEGIVIQEKIDWANLSIWLEEGEIRVGSRNQDVTNKSFNWAVEYVRSHPWIIQLLKDNPEYRLFGEWLVPHTITNYNSDAYRHFYIFDILLPSGEFLDPLEVNIIANKYNIKKPEVFAVLDFPSYEEIEEYAGKSFIWPNWEGVVIKNPLFINKFLNKQYWKIVTKEFKESNGITFWNHRRDDKESKLTNKFVTIERIKKIINKIEQNEDRDVQKWDINKIIWLTFHDIVTEEISSIIKEDKISFKKLNKLVGQKTWMLSSQLISGELVSVAFNETN